VQVFSTSPLDSKKGSRGSGYLLANGLVLTARHVLAPAEWGALPDPLEIIARPVSECKFQTARLVWPVNPEDLANKTTDVALIQLANVPDHLRSAEILIGLDDTGDGRKIQVYAAGFPNFMEIPTSIGPPQFDTFQMYGTVAPFTGEASGTLAIDWSKQKASLDVKGRQIGALDWRGFSGAALFARARRLIGVVIKENQDQRFDFRAARLDKLQNCDDFLAALNIGSATNIASLKKVKKQYVRAGRNRPVGTATSSLSEAARNTYISLINYLMRNQRADGLFSSYDLRERRPSATATSIALLALHECDEVETGSSVERAVDGLIAFRETASGITAWPAQTGEELHIHNNAWAILAVSRVRGVAGVRLIDDTGDWIARLQDSKSGAFPFFADAKGRLSSQASVYATANVIRALLAFLSSLALMPDAARRADAIRVAIYKGLGYLEAVNAAQRSRGRIGWPADSVGDLVPCLATTSLAAHVVLRAHQQGIDQGSLGIDHARECMVGIASAIADARQSLKDTTLTVKHDGGTTDLVTWPHIHITDPAQYFFSYYTPVILRTFIDSGLLQAHEVQFRAASRKIVRWMVEIGEAAPGGDSPPLVNVHGQRFGTWVAAQAALTLGGALRRRADWFA
jgi:hypothetical protein